jgi:hypothetical protein
MMAFKADDAETTEILAYCKSKHFKSIPAFIRYAVFGYMEKHVPGAHHPVTGKPRGRPTKTKAGAKYVENGDNSVPHL